MVTLNKNFYRGLQLIYFLCKALFLLLFRLIFYVIILKFCSIFFDLFYFYFYDNINKFSIENDFIMFQLYVYCENELSYFYNLIDLFIYIFLIYIFFQELPYESREDYNFEQYLIIPKYVRRRLTYLDVLKRNPKKYANWLKKEKIRNYWCKKFFYRKNKEIKKFNINKKNFRFQWRKNLKQLKNKKIKKY